MRESGQVIWLTAAPETIHARMSGDATTAARRPSLTNRGALEEIIHLIEKREPVYRETAHHQIDAEGKSPEAVVAEILEKLHLPAVPGGAS